MASIRNIQKPKVVTFHPDAESDYGVVECSWELETRKQPITMEAAQKFAEGWKAEFRAGAVW